MIFFYQLKFTNFNFQVRTFQNFGNKLVSLVQSTDKQTLVNEPDRENLVHQSASGTTVIHPFNGGCNKM